jgi:iron complex transport system ATP-binding protein
MPAIEVSHVSVAFNGARVLDGLSLSVDAGRWVCLIGPNGAGKTTLLRSILGLVDHSGEISIDGVPLEKLRRRELSKRIAVVPQKPVIPAAMTVTDYTLMGRTPYISYLGTETRGDLEIVRGVFEQLDLGSLAKRALGTLSGGELQRVILARALAQQAPVLLLDEPTSGLDVGHQQQVLELVESLRIENRLTILSAMHDLTLAGQFADELLLLASGRAVVSGPARIVLTEGAIRRHYGAEVRVLEDDDGAIVVIPVRPARGEPSREMTGRSRAEDPPITLPPKQL